MGAIDDRLKEKQERERKEAEEKLRAMTWQEHLDLALVLASRSYNYGDTVAHHSTIQTQLMFALVKQGRVPHII